MRFAFSHFFKERNSSEGEMLLSDGVMCPHLAFRKGRMWASWLLDFNFLSLSDVIFIMRIPKGSDVQTSFYSKTFFFFFRQNLEQEF